MLGIRHGSNSVIFFHVDAQFSQHYCQRDYSVSIVHSWCPWTDQLTLCGGVISELSVQLALDSDVLFALL